MKFKQWLESYKDLANQFKNTLGGVPQDPKHHFEGDVLVHTKLVRKAIPGAINELKKLKESAFADVFKNLDFNCSEQELQILYLSAWLHDIGKYSATTIDGKFWKDNPVTGKIQSIGHQNPEHYMPQIEKLKQYASTETVNLYLQNKDLINFLIDHHMDFTSGNGFSKSFVLQNFKNGVINNDIKMKLLLILMWADKMGRKPEDTIQLALLKNNENLKNSISRSLQQHKIANKPDFNSPEELVKKLKERMVDDLNIIKALRGKFPYLSEEEIKIILAK